MSGHACWLLALPPIALEELDAATRVYLRRGVREGLHETPTAKRLRRWYALPIPGEPPDFLVTYLFRGAPRFVCNDARVFHLTNMLGGRLRKAGGQGDIGRVVGALNDAADEWMRDGAGREYRDGLRKVEPRELERQAIGDGLLAKWGIAGAVAAEGESRWLFGE